MENNSLLIFTSFFLIIILFSSIFDARLIFKSTKKSCYLPNGCRWLVKSKHNLDESFLVCSRLDAIFDYVEYDNSTMGMCQPIERTSNNLFVFKHEPSDGFIIDYLFNLFETSKYIPNFLFGEPVLKDYKIVNANGFTIDCNIHLNRGFSAKIEVWNSKFRFYIQDKASLDSKLIRTCEGIDDSSLADVNDLKRNFIFKKSEIEIWLAFSNCKFDTPVCPIVFNNTKIDWFEISFMVNSYYKKNVIKFLDFNSSILKSKIRFFSLYNFYGLDLNWNIINPVIFVSTTTFRFQGVINSIQIDLFSKFVNFTDIFFDIDTLKSIIKRKGLDWIRGINSNIRVNMSDRKSINTSIRALKRVS